MLLHNSAQFSANGEIQLLGAHNIPQCGPITAVLHYVCCAFYAELRMYMRGCVLFMWRCIILEQSEN